jgi:hypothetical protein
MSATPFERFEVIRQVTSRLRFISDIESGIQAQFCALETIGPELLRAIAGLNGIGVLHVEPPMAFLGGRFPVNPRISDGKPAMRQEFRELNRLIRRFCSETHCYRIGKTSGKLILTGRLGPDSWCVLLIEFKDFMER